MKLHAVFIATTFAAAGLISSPAHATLQGRDLNGSAGSFEAYYDTELDITWLADANYAKTSNYDADGKMTWDAANIWAANLSFTDGVIVYDNWRLPTVNPVNGANFNYSYSTDGSTDWGYNTASPQNEIGHMFYVTLGNFGRFNPDGTSSGCYVNGSSSCLVNVGPFSNLYSGSYFFGTEYAPGSSTMWEFITIDGQQNYGRKDIDGHNYSWAVSSGDVAAVPEAQTYALMLAGLGLIGWRARRHE
jgi:hypothetical protein